VSLDTAPAPAPDEPEEELDRPGPGRRILHHYLYAGPVTLTILAFICGAVLGAIMMVLSDPATRTAAGYFFAAPGDTFSAGWHAIAAGYSALFRGAIFNTDALYSNGGVPIFGPIANTLSYATPLILGGLAVGVAFRAGLFNIGVQGQLIMGAICAGVVGFDVSLPPVIHLVAALLAGVVGGALWAGVAGWLKARTGAHEVITTIMLNYVALYFLDYLLGVSGFQLPNSNEAVSKPISNSARLPHLFGSNLPVRLDLLIALAAAGGVWWLLSRSTLGFSLRAIGANQNAARTAGMNVERGYLTVMLISGALAGLVGCSQALGARAGGFDNSVDAGFGFDAITVALLGLGSPWGTVLAGLFFGALNAGRVVMNASTSTPSDVVSVMEAVIVLFIAAPALVRSIFRLRQARGGSRVSALAKGWNG
jgi:general nucleoside transport system permease protein